MAAAAAAAAAPPAFTNGQTTPGNRIHANGQDYTPTEFGAYWPTLGRNTARDLLLAVIEYSHQNVQEDQATKAAMRQAYMICQQIEEHPVQQLIFRAINRRNSSSPHRSAWVRYQRLARRYRLRHEWPQYHEKPTATDKTAATELKNTLRDSIPAQLRPVGLTGRTGTVSYHIQEEYLPDDAYDHIVRCRAYDELREATRVHDAGMQDIIASEAVVRIGQDTVGSKLFKVVTRRQLRTQTQQMFKNMKPADRRRLLAAWNDHLRVQVRREMK